MIKQISANKTGLGMSYYMLGGEIARTLGPLLITAAISLWGLEGSYRVMLLAFISTIFLYNKLKDVQVNKDFHKKTKEFTPKDTLKKLISILHFNFWFCPISFSNEICSNFIFTNFSYK